MKLIDDWKKKFHRLWSVRLSLLSAIASAAQVGTELYANNTPTKLVVAACVASVGAAVARLIAQPKLNGAKDGQD